MTASTPAKSPVDVLREALDYMERITLALGPGERTTYLANGRDALADVDRLVEALRAVEAWVRRAEGSEAEAAELLDAALARFPKEPS